MDFLTNPCDIFNMHCLVMILPASATIEPCFRDSILRMLNCIFQLDGDEKKLPGNNCLAVFYRSPSFLKQKTATETTLMMSLTCKDVTDKLDCEHQNHDENQADPDNIVLVAQVPCVDGEVTQTTTTDSARHCG